MKKDTLTSLLVALLVVGMVFILTRSVVLDIADNHPILMSYIKFFLLASIGDCIGYRLQLNEWQLPPKIIHKGIVWGIIGIVIYYMFQIYPAGVTALQANQLLPFEASTFATAFFVSLIMNVTFAPTMMSVHRISDSFLNAKTMDKKSKVMNIINEINWGQFYRFTFLRTIPFFWIPAHTLTFILPSEYRIIFAALLGIILGILLRFTEKKKVND
jgi:hypothetical protein